MKKYWLIGVWAFIWALLAAPDAQAQDKPAKAGELKIKTSAQCGMCKEAIEKAMSFEKGVKFANLDVDSKVLTVRYKASKTSPDKIRQAVAKTGYDADEVPAVQAAYDKLPDCCKKGAHDNDKSGHHE
jgi:copper chaperone CopZ